MDEAIPSALLHLLSMGREVATTYIEKNSPAVRVSFFRLKILKPLAARRMAELAKSLCLDLTDTLTRNVEMIADFFERLAVSVFKAETHLNDFPLPVGEGVENVAYDLSLERLSRDVGR